MDTSLLLSFLMVSGALIIIPGPNVLVIVATSSTHGLGRGLQTIAGTTTAMAIQLAIAAVATAWFVQRLAYGFHILKWMGAAYLLLLALQHLKRLFVAHHVAIPLSAGGSFARGFIVSLTNPKTIVFFSAWLPQFISPSGSYNEQIIILSAMFLCLAALLDSCYALLSSRLRSLLQHKNLCRIQHGCAGLALMGASAWLAVARRGQ